MATKWEKVATVQSQSNPMKAYTISRHPASGQLGCNCPQWIYGRSRTCKHIQKLAATFEPLVMDRVIDAELAGTEAA
jgi:hypothetical protein